MEPPSKEYLRKQRRLSELLFCTVGEKAQAPDRFVVTQISTNHTDETAQITLVGDKGTTLKFTAYVEDIEIT